MRLLQWGGNIHKILCFADQAVLKELENETRIVMHLHPNVAPYKAAILPLSKKLGEKAEEILFKLNKVVSVTYDDTGSIGKRYRRQDAIGTPYCITVDFDTLENNTVTIVPKPIKN